MKRIATGIACALALAACSSEEAAVEKMIRDGIEPPGTASQVDMTRQDDNHYNGFAMIRGANGAERRSNCTAERLDGKGNRFSWRCVPANDEPMQAEVEESIRRSYSSRATVREVDMSRRDEDHMQGFALLTDSLGNEARVECSAARNTSGTFDWNCARPAGASAGQPVEGDQ